MIIQVNVLIVIQDCSIVVSIRASGDPGLETLAGEPFVAGKPLLSAGDLSPG